MRNISTRGALKTSLYLFLAISILFIVSSSILVSSAGTYDSGLISPNKFLSNSQPDRGCGPPCSAYWQSCSRCKEDYGGAVDDCGGFIKCDWKVDHSSCGGDGQINGVCSGFDGGWLENDIEIPSSPSGEWNCEISVQTTKYELSGGDNEIVNVYLNGNRLGNNPSINDKCSSSSCSSTTFTTKFMNILVTRNSNKIKFEFPGESVAVKAYRFDCEEKVQAPVCGNGQLESGEECDDGNNNNGDGCSASCENEFCGDGEINNVDEECDPPNTNLNSCDYGQEYLQDRCNSNCKIVDTSCEDDFSGCTSDPECDETQPGSGNCDNQCQINSFCGDGSIDSGEECDDGNDNGEVCVPGYGSSCNYCSDDCDVETVDGPFCGDGSIDLPDEECEYNNQCSDGNPNTVDTCSSCSCNNVDPNVCGDGNLDPGEECDPPNNALATCDYGQDYLQDFCDSNCQFADDNCEDDYPGCTSDPECDEVTPGTGNCDLSCNFTPDPVCGDGSIDSGEECDDGSSNGNVCVPGYGSSCNYCSDDCDVETVDGPFCGDDIVNGPEECEFDIQCNDQDPNTIDTCNSCNCNNVDPVVCGDGNLDSGEECDDGNNDNDDGCDAFCVIEYCGDGVVNNGEECEPKNNELAACSIYGEDYLQDFCDANCELMDDNCEDDYNDCTADPECDEVTPGTFNCDLTCQYTPDPDCGNGIIESGEECDDGNSNNNDDCKNDCTDNVCGDNFIYTSVEDCELPSTSNNIFCGQTTEQCVGPKLRVRDLYGNCNNLCDCDDDNFGPLNCVKDKCGADCAVDTDCDDGNSNTLDTCNTDTCGCSYQTLQDCGNGIVESPEECDDGNNINDDGCSASCELESVCGNFVIEDGEECDPPNNALATCSLYGEDFLQDFCDSNCQLMDDNCEDDYPGCTADPQCDEVTPGTGNCDLSCDFTPDPVCGDGSIDSGEECDDGNDNGNVCVPAYNSQCSYCDSNCDNQIVDGGYCGDGNLDEPQEECDDGNNNNGDGCSENCLVEDSCPPYGQSHCDWGFCTEDCPCNEGFGDCDNNQECSGDLVCVFNVGDEGYGCIDTVDICLPPEECGDGNIDSGEECDDGADNGEVCVPGYGSSCTYCNDGCEEITVDGPFCGDGSLDSPYEECEPANVVLASCDVYGQDYLQDFCDSNCQLMDDHCEDDFPGCTSDPECDEEIPGTGNCDSTCGFTPDPFCGDGNLDSGEECDEGNDNGIVCVPGYGSSCDYCSNGCTEETLDGPFCGDTIINGQEECESDNHCNDGNPNTVDTCDSCSCNNNDPIVCGDGNLDSGEECDDGNNVNGDGCNSNCVDEFCGDDIVNDNNEECDDGNDNGNVCVPNYNDQCAYCDSNCDDQIVEGGFCGDGNLDSPDEECDDGNNLDDDGCSATCEIEPEPECGNGVLEEGEECEPAGFVMASCDVYGEDYLQDFCDSNCRLMDDNCEDQFPGCTSAPECDELAPGTGNCDLTCQVIAVCGNDDVEPGEECDDGNTNDNDGCDSDCVVEFCGDNILQTSEECDDGNNNNGDGCSSDCLIESSCPPEGQSHCDWSFCSVECPCSEGFGDCDNDQECQIGLECELNVGTEYGCAPSVDICVNNTPACGDGSLDIGEDCDDGNLINGDGCEDDCTLTYECGNDDVEPGEECDNGNDNGNVCVPDYNNQCSYCEDNCTNVILDGPFCGDGNLDGNDGEECDDGNNDNGDGCSYDCLIETVCGNGQVESGEECDDGNNDNNDGCSFDCLIEQCAYNISISQTYTGSVNGIRITDEGGNDVTQDPADLLIDENYRFRFKVDNNLYPNITPVDVHVELLINALVVYAEDISVNSFSTADTTLNLTFFGEGNHEITATAYVNNPSGLDCSEDDPSRRTVNVVDNRTFCGDNVMQSPNDFGQLEECDDGANGDNNDQCDDSCHLTSCGDLFVQQPNGLGTGGPLNDGVEDCDDGADGDDTDRCYDHCEFTFCGDSIIQDPNGYGVNEDCDDGNLDETDDCANDCSLTYCGDSLTQSPNGAGQLEECDDGQDGDNTNQCDDSCHRTSCGDGFVQTPNGLGVGGPNDDGVEACDDGNDVDDDACNNNCELTSCGDNVVNNGEDCDDGQNGDDTDGCNDQCSFTFCGDNVVQQPNGEGDVEFCDDGANGDDTDGCDDWCHLTFCGDNIVQDPNGLGNLGATGIGDEECDDGANGNNSDNCLDNCTSTSCGDGYVQSILGEECDDANSNSSDSCNSCSLTVCGDSIIQSPNGYLQLEECDDGADGDNSNECDDSCHRTSCGDGFVQAPNGIGIGGPQNDGVEECDDGNLNSTDSCNNQCISNVCGDGIVNNNEPCDDGANGDDTDGCTDSCELTFCGDETVQQPNGYGDVEFCDDGANGNDADLCDDWCHLTFCGDNIVQYPNGLGEDGLNDSGLELCDDGSNGNDTDFCYDDCTPTFCGDGILQTVNGEVCDDGNDYENDTCNNACQLTVCGDGIQQIGNGYDGQLEECDDGADGNNSNLCDDSCHRTSCGDAIVQSPNGLGNGGPLNDGYEECDDGNQVHNDSCRNDCSWAPVCSDGQDNDGDGFIDFPADPGCEGPDDTSEFDDCTLFHDVNNQTLPNPLAFAPQVFLDPESREVIDDDDPSCDEVTRNYAFEGEQISVDVLVWDKNGVPNKIFDVYWGLGRDGPPSTTRCVESNCNFIGCRDEDNDQECDDPPGVLIGDPVPLVWDGNTMGWYECILTVEPGWHGQYWASVQAVDNDGLVGQIDEQEFWFFNPTYTIEVSDDIVFDNLAAGTRSYARTVSVQNNAELNSGLMLDMYIGGNNDFDLTSFGAACPTSNQMRLNYNQDNYCDGYDDPNNSGATNAIHDNFCYYGTSGSYSTCSNEGTDPECYDEINYALPGQTQNARRVLQFDTGIPGTSATLLTPNSEFYNYSSNRRFELLVDGDFISFLFTNNDNLSAVQVAQEINTEAAIVDASLSMIASVEGGQVRITSPTTGTSSTIVILDGSGNPQLGFSDFDSDSGTDGVFATNVETIGCGQYPSGNVLAPGQEMSVTMRLDVPIPCNGNFGPVFDNIYFWGEPI